MHLINQRFSSNPFVKSLPNIMNHTILQSSFKQHLQWNKGIFWCYNTDHQFALISNYFSWSKSSEKDFVSLRTRKTQWTTWIFETQMFHTYLSCLASLTITSRRWWSLQVTPRKAGGRADTLEGGGTQTCQRNGANRNFIEFRKDKCKVLHMGSRISCSVAGWVNQLQAALLKTPWGSSWTASWAWPSSVHL